MATHGPPAWLRLAPVPLPTPATILVVDDQPYVRRILRSLLAEQSHWKIYEAENGKRWPLTEPAQSNRR